MRGDGDMFSFLNANAGAIGVIFSGLVTAATVVYAVLTWRLVTETRRSRKAQTNPSISVMIETNPVSFHALDLVVRNEGPGAAHNIHFEIEMEHPDTGDKQLLERIHKLGFVSDGVTYLAPRQELRSFLEMSFNNYDEKVATVLRVRTRYRTPDGSHESGSHLVDLSWLRNMSQLGTPPMQEMAKSLKALQKDINHLVTGWRKLKIITQDKADLEREEHERRLEWMEEQELERLAKRTQGVET